MPPFLGPAAKKNGYSASSLRPSIPRRVGPGDLSWLTLMANPYENSVLFGCTQANPQFHSN